jgi:hypothetical protein
MNESWVKVYASHDFYKSELVKQFLVDNEIEAVVLDKQGYPYQLGETEVYVSNESAEKASGLIAQNDL